MQLFKKVTILGIDLVAINITLLHALNIGRFELI